MPFRFQVLKESKFKEHGRITPGELKCQARQSLLADRAYHRLQRSLWQLGIS